jgi:hypothetical protein
LSQVTLRRGSERHELDLRLGTQSAVPCFLDFCKLRERHEGFLAKVRGAQHVADGHIANAHLATVGKPVRDIRAGVVVVHNGGIRARSAMSTESLPRQFLTTTASV